MSMSIERVLAAYRPLYLRGLLMDGQYRLPAKPEPQPPAVPVSAKPEACRDIALPGKALAGVPA
ncbi:hypothetical protein [Dyella silvatica]|uniref:hypothetical protein n=1 Tax=Dyella silvatica TaxID=2992128 RepID=UPI00225752FF|nr:hypothetical protein [Dyella silvatica]